MQDENNRTMKKVKSERLTLIGILLERVVMALKTNTSYLPSQCKPRYQNKLFGGDRRYSAQFGDS